MILNFNFVTFCYCLYTCYLFPLNLLTYIPARLFKRKVCSGPHHDQLHLTLGDTDLAKHLNAVYTGMSHPKAPAVPAYMECKCKWELFFAVRNLNTCPYLWLLLHCTCDGHIWICTWSLNDCVGLVSIFVFCELPDKHELYNTQHEQSL